MKLALIIQGKKMTVKLNKNVFDNILAIILSVTLVAACQHVPHNKTGKAYDADSLRCFWDDSTILAQQKQQKYRENHGQIDSFEQSLDKQAAVQRTEQDCESITDYKNRKVTKQTQLEQAINNAIGNK